MGTITIGDSFEVLNGYAFKSEKYTSSGIRVIRIANVQKGYIEDDSPVFYQTADVDLNKYMLRENDLLVSLTGNVGRTALLTKDMLPAVLNQRVACLRLKTNKITRGFLFHLLNSDYFESKCIQSSQGVAQKNLSTEWLKSYDLPLYSLSKQNEITKILDNLRNTIILKEQEINKFDELIKARFIEMFGDPVSNSKHLPLKTLPQLGTFGRGVSKYRPRNAPELLNGPYPLIQTGDIANSELYIKNYNNTYSEVGLKQSKMWDKGTLCITIAANIAKTAILQFDACFPDSVVGFNGNNLTDNIFVHYWFSFFQEILENQAPESAQKNINLKILSELQIITPDIIEQNQFVNFVRQVDKSREAVKKSLEKTKQLYDSLMQEYFG